MNRQLYCCKGLIQQYFRCKERLFPRKYISWNRLYKKAEITYKWDIDDAIPDELILHFWLTTKYRILFIPKSINNSVALNTSMDIIEIYTFLPIEVGNVLPF